MKRTFVPLAMLLAACTYAAPLQADDFRLVVESRGYDKIDPETIPDKLPVRNRMELRIRNGERFSSSVLVDGLQLNLSGIVRRRDDGTWEIEAAYSEKKMDGFVPGENGTRQPVYDRLKAGSTLEIIPNEEMVLGGFQTKDERTGTVSRAEVWLKLARSSEDEVQ